MLVSATLSPAVAERNSTPDPGRCTPLELVVNELKAKVEAMERQMQADHLRTIAFCDRISQILQAQSETLGGLRTSLGDTATDGGETPAEALNDTSDDSGQGNCPACGSTDIRFSDFDNGRCSQTGYSDSGTRFECAGCGSTGDAADTMPARSAA